MQSSSSLFRWATRYEFVFADLDGWGLDPVANICQDLLCESSSPWQIFGLNNHRRVIGLGCAARTAVYCAWRAVLWVYFAAPPTGFRLSRIPDRVLRAAHIHRACSDM